MLKDEIMQKSWITAYDIQILIPDLPIQKCREVCKKILKEMDQEGAYYFETKKLLVPTKRVKKLLGL